MLLTPKVWFSIPNTSVPALLMAYGDLQPNVVLISTMLCPHATAESFKTLLSLQEYKGQFPLGRAGQGKVCRDMAWSNFAWVSKVGIQLWRHVHFLRLLWTLGNLCTIQPYGSWGGGGMTCRCMDWLMASSPSWLIFCHHGCCVWL